MATRFRLATLLKMRERERDNAGLAVQEAQTAIERVEEARREIADLNRALDDSRKNASAGTVSLNRLLDAQRYQMVLAAQDAQLVQNLQTLNEELNRRQIILVERQKAVKSLEKLREQRQQAEYVQQLSKDQERLDEWANTRFARPSDQHAADF